MFSKNSNVVWLKWNNVYKRENYREFMYCTICSTQIDINHFAAFQAGICNACKITSYYNVNLHPSPEIEIRRKGLRVLSLFDGIASGLVALKQLNIPIEAYYASEIDRYAMEVSNKNFQKLITHLGDVTKIDETVLMQIGPIDLLLAGSPCNDLSLANPVRKGLMDSSGTGILFFEFYRILMALKRVNEKPFFWLFENVASMTNQSKQMVTRFLETEPRKINAAWVSAQNRQRYFWGNCPSLKENFDSEGPILQEYLTKGRKARVEKLNTITTSSNSLRQGKISLLPVMTSNNKPDMLTINEIEAVFGFKKNYTQFRDYPKTLRQQLIGRSWSVQVAFLLLKFLKQHFRTRN